MLSLAPSEFARVLRSVIRKACEAITMKHLVWSTERFQDAYARGDMFEKRRRLRDTGVCCCARPAKAGEVGHLVRAGT
jgi:hypothetical protein